MIKQIITLVLHLINNKDQATHTITEKYGLVYIMNVDLWTEKMKLRKNRDGVIEMMNPLFFNAKLGAFGYFLHLILTSIKPITKTIFKVI